MSLPGGITTCNLTAGPVTDMFGNTIDTTLQVTPVFGGSLTAIVWSATGADLTNDPSTALAIPAGTQGTIAVPHVNQTGFLDQSGAAFTMWAYTCVLSKAGSRSAIWTKSVQPLVGQSTVDLDEVVAGGITPPSSAPFPTVLSVNGLTGAVVVGGGGGGGSVTSVAGRTGDVVLVKADVGLNNVNNTADASKPVSTATQTALNLKADDASTVHTSGAESIAGVKTFSAPPVSATAPTTGNQVTNKTYVDSVATGAADATTSSKGIVQLAGDLAGTATSPTTPTAVHITGAESIAGVKTFGSSPIVPTPTTSTQAANKSYVDAHAVDYPTLPAGVTLTLIKAAGVWPGVPTTRTDIPIRWQGASPPPSIVSSRTLSSAGMLNGVDIWDQTP